MSFFSQVSDHNPAPVTPLPALPLSALPVDPCDIHVQFPEDHVLAESSSGSHCCSLEQTSGTSVGQSSLGAAYWDSGGLDSGIGTAHTQWV